MLFSILLELVMANATEGADLLRSVISVSINSNLRFVDDIATLAESSNDLPEMVINISCEDSRLELHTNAQRKRRNTSQNRMAVP